MSVRFGFLGGLIMGLALLGTAQAQPLATADDPIALARLAIGQGRYGDALHALEAPQSNDLAEAQFLRAELYSHGLGVAQNFDTAMTYYHRAADLGSLAAENALGRAYAEGRAVAPDARLALQHLTAAARSGDAEYQTDLARALDTGLGGESKPDEAAIWYRRAADQGHLDAITSLGVLYLEGRGVERDAGRAIGLFAQASAGGDSRAQNNLGLIYVRGEDVERDYDRAFELFSAAAEQGQREALNNLSVMYASGFGVAVNEAESLRLLEQARRARGLTLSALLQQIGFPYDARLVSPNWEAMPDPAQEQAALAGDPVALYWTGIRYLEGVSVRQDIALGTRRLEQSARAGLGGAQLLLGLIYANGRGVPQDYESAYFWVSLASLSAVSAAADVRDALAREMSAAQLHDAQERVASELAARD